MAQGDIRAETTNVAAAGYLNVQPAAGESWIIKDIFASGDATNAGWFCLYDGTSQSSHVNVSTDDFHFNSYRFRVGPDLKCDYINNSLYLRVYNHSASARVCGIIALQIK